MITTAIFLSGYNIRNDICGGEKARQILEQLGSQTPVTEIPDFVDENREEEAEYPDYMLNPSMEMPVREIDGELYIGILEIPSRNLRLPIQSEWSYSGLRMSPCRYEGSAYLNNLIICGHNYDAHFGGLKYLEKGELVRFTDNDGNVFNYQVANTDVLDPTALNEMRSGAWDLTLFTCTIGGAARVTVRCEIMNMNSAR